MTSLQHDIVTVSGLPGSGTSTVCGLIEKQTRWSYINAGEIFRELAAAEGLSLAELGARAEADPEIDRRLDARMVMLAEQFPNVILEGRLVGWMADRFGLGACKVWLGADVHTRARRCSSRDGDPLDETERAMLARERSEAARYRDHHGIDVADLSIYDLVIDSTSSKPAAIAAQILGTLGRSQG